MTEVEEVGQHWQDEARAARGEADEEPIEEIDVGPREVTEEEWQRICAAEKGWAEKHGRYNPLG